MLEVALYSMLSVGLDVPVEADNPYDPAQIRIDVRLLRPDGNTQDWPAFYDGAAWVWRYRPVQEGAYNGRVLVDGVEGDVIDFIVADQGRTSPLVVDGLGFRTTDGRAFVPLGLNLGWSAGGGTDDYERWFGAMRNEGGNFARLWFTHFTSQDPEWTSPLGTMDPSQARNIDTILDLAAAQGILLMPVLWQHSELECNMWSSWKENPYNAANGGPCADSPCFFTDPAALDFESRFLRYAVARWGAHPALGAWEVMNEIDGVTGVSPEVASAWAADRANEIRELEEGLHPVSWSYAMPYSVDDDQYWDEADFTQVHSYLLDDAEPVALGVAALLAAWDKPVLVGEWGLDWFGKGDLADTEGLAWQNANWAAIASGSAGNALTWWWDNHVEPEGLWYRLEAPAMILSFLDLPSMVPVEVVTDDDDIMALGRSDGETTLIWVHDLECTPPETACDPIEGLELILDLQPPLDMEAFDPVWGGHLSSGRVESWPLVIDAPGDVAIVMKTTEPESGPPATDKDGGCGCTAGVPRGGFSGVFLALFLGFRRRYSRPSGDCRDGPGEESR